MSGSRVVRLVCPNLKCRAVLAVPETARGKTVKCKHCGNRLSVPAARAAPTDAAASHGEAKTQ